MPLAQTYEPAGYRVRLVAFFADLALIAITFLVGGFIWSFFAAADFFFLYVFAAAWLSWQTGGARKGQSPGKRLVGIRVINDEGEVPELGWMLVRDWGLRGFFGFWILQYFSDLQWGLVGNIVVLGLFSLAALWCLWDGERQCLWDKVLTTRVVDA